VRQPRVHLRTMMAAVAFLALALAVIVQSVRINQSLIREQRLRSEVESQMVQAGLQRMQAEAAEYRRKAETTEYRRKLAIVEEMYAGVPERQRQGPPAAPKP
jgi:hypothetical protein